MTFIVIIFSIPPKAANAMNTCYIASTYSTCTLEEISAAAPGGFRWFQLYIHRNRAVSQQLVQRAEALGFQGLVLTADLPYTGKRRDDVRNGFRLPPHMKLKNLEGAFEVGKMILFFHSRTGVHHIQQNHQVTVALASAEFKAYLLPSCSCSILA